MRLNRLRKVVAMAWQNFCADYLTRVFASLQSNGRADFNKWILDALTKDELAYSAKNCNLKGVEQWTGLDDYIIMVILQIWVATWSISPKRAWVYLEVAFLDKVIDYTLDTIEAVFGKDESTNGIIMRSFLAELRLCSPYAMDMVTSAWEMRPFPADCRRTFHGIVSYNDNRGRFASFRSPRGTVSLVRHGGVLILGNYKGSGEHERLEGAKLRCDFGENGEFTAIEVADFHDNKIFGYSTMHLLTALNGSGTENFNMLEFLDDQVFDWTTHVQRARLNPGHWERIKRFQAAKLRRSGGDTRIILSKETRDKAMLEELHQKVEACGMGCWM